MFTGIVEEIGTILTLEQKGNNQIELSIACKKIQEEMKLGDSVAVNGICLTVVSFNDQAVSFDVSSETIRLSTFSEQSTGTKVNLERALRLSDRLGGHLVQGHVDCLAVIRRINRIGDFYEIDFSFPEEISRYLVKKGSVTIDGISLTVADLSADWFRVAVIPHTFKETVLSSKREGDKVHIESDVIARYVERLLMNPENNEKKSIISEEFLKKHGF